MNRDPLKDPQPGDWICDHGTSEDDHGDYVLVVGRDGDMVLVVSDWGGRSSIGVDRWAKYYKGYEVLYVAGT